MALVLILNATAQRRQALNSLVLERCSVAAVSDSPCMAMSRKRPQREIAGSGSVSQGSSDADSGESDSYSSSGSSTLPTTGLQQEVNRFSNFSFNLLLAQECDSDSDGVYRR